MQQCRYEEINNVKYLFSRTGICADVNTFFGNIPKHIADATLIICRSGASTISELAVAGRPALLVPFPYAADDHQRANAETLCDAGGAWIIQQNSLSVDLLVKRLTSLLEPSPTLSVAASCARQIGKPEAASLLADLVISVVSCDGTNPLAEVFGAVS